MTVELINAVCHVAMMALPTRFVDRLYFRNEIIQCGHLAGSVNVFQLHLAFTVSCDHRGEVVLRLIRSILCLFDATIYRLH